MPATALLFLALAAGCGSSASPAQSPEPAVTTPSPPSGLVNGTRCAALRVQLQANVLNLFSQRAVLNKIDTVQRSGAIPLSRTGAPGFYNEAAFYAGQLDFTQLIAQATASGALTPDPRFLMASSYQAPIAARFGIKFVF